jgi:hypothetical protein
VDFARFAFSIALPFADSQLWDTFSAGKVSEAVLKEFNAAS